MSTSRSRSLTLILWLTFVVGVVAMMDVPSWGGALIVALAAGVPWLIAWRAASPPNGSLSEQIQRALR
jgi:hypothetical protein